MNATMTKTPTANSTACRTCAPVSSRPNRIASAQPPANAAPNTSAPIRIAAERTVMTLGQRITFLPGEVVCRLMDQVLFRGRNLSEKCPCIKHKRPKNAVSRDIDWVIFSRAFSSEVDTGSREENASKMSLEPAWDPEAKNGNCDVRNPANGSHQSSPDAVADAVRDAAFCRDRPGAFPAGVRAGLRRSRSRDRRHHPRPGGARLRQHHHGAGALRQAALQGLGGVLRPGLGALQSGDS